MAQGNAVSYRVTGVQRQTAYSATGVATPGKQVTYTTSNGYEGQLFIADADFGNPERVRQLIEAEVKMVTAALGLSGTVTG